MQGTSDRQYRSDEDPQLIPETNRYCDGENVEHAGGFISDPHESQAHEYLPVHVQSQSLVGSFHPDVSSASPSPHEHNLTVIQLMSDEHTQEEGQSVDHASQQYPLGQAFEAYERRYRHLGDIEFDNSSRRMELHHRLDNFQQHFYRLRNSFESLIEPPPNTDDSNTSPKKPRARRKRLQANVKLDLEALEKQFHALIALTEDLRSNDRKQEDAERTFNNAAQTIATKLRQSKLVPENETALEVSLAPTIASESEHPSNVSPPIAAELEAYYAAVSTLRNMGERIGELQAEQQEQWERRGVMEDQGQVLDQNEDEFLRTWNETLEIAYKDFTTAQADVKRTRQDCEAMDIAIPTWAEVDSEGEGADPLTDDLPAQDVVNHPNSMPGTSQPTPDSSQPRAQRALSLLFNEPSLHGRESQPATPPLIPMTENRVARWIEDTDTPLESQLHGFPQGTPIALSEGITPAMEPQDIALPPPIEHRWSTSIPVSARSENAAATTSAYTVSFGAVTAVPRPSSLHAGQDLEVGDDLRRAPRKTT